VVVFLPSIVVCRFEQTFYIKSHCNGRPSMTDRLVTVWLQEQIEA
jgi:hypothetical protein